MSINTLNQSERRKLQRYAVEDLAIAITKNHDARMGRIVNISQGGMAIRYFAEREWLADRELIDILFERRFFMTNVPVRNVRDFAVSKDSINNHRERQCCLEFAPLSSEQKLLLQEFITKQKQ